jgi:WD40 repeat protein
MRRILTGFAAVAIAFGFSLKATAAPAANEIEIVPQITHSTNIHSIVFSPNGRLLVTSDSEHSVKLWDTKSGLLLRSLTVFDVHTVIFSPDSRFLVSGQSDGTITFWDASTGNPQRRLKDAKYVRSLAFSSDGRILASMTLDNVQIWDVERGKRRLTLTPPHEIGAMALSADGRSIIAGGEEHTGGSRDPASREARQGLLDSIHEAARDELSASDRAGLSSGLGAAKGDEHVKGVALSLWETTNGKLLKTVRIGPSRQKTQEFNVGFLAFAAGGRDIICETEETGENWSDRDLRLRVLDAASGREVRVLASDDTMLAVDISSDRRAVAVGGLRAVRLLDPTNGKEFQRLDTKSMVGILAIAPDNRTVAGGADRRPRIWDFATANDVGSAHQLNPFDKMAVTRDGQTIIGFGNEQLRLWDAKTGRLLHSFNIDSAQGDASFSADGTLFAAVAEIKQPAGSATFRLKIFEVATGREIRTLDFVSSHWPTAISLSPDGKSVLLLASSKDRQNRLQLWDAQTGKKLHDVAKCTECDALLAFAPDSQSFITGDNGFNFDGGNHDDGYRLTLWDTKSADMVKTIDHVNGLFASASAFLPDGRGFALAGVGEPISLRETASLGLLRVTGKKKRHGSHQQSVGLLAGWPNDGFERR